MHRTIKYGFWFGQDMNATKECASAGSYPLLRFMTYTQNKSWAVASPETACTGSGFAPFSAVCYYFGKNILERLNGTVPIGLVSSNVGGTAVERWSGPDAIKACSQSQVVNQSTLWTPFIVPLLQMQISGWIWYQGNFFSLNVHFFSKVYIIFTGESNVACSTSWQWVPGSNCAIGCKYAPFLQFYRFERLVII